MLSLHKDLKKKLVELLKEAFNKVKVRNKIYLDDSCALFLTLENCLPQHGKITDDLNQYIGDFPFLTFVKSELSRELREKYNYEKGTDLENLTDLLPNLDLAEIIIERLCTLPWEYMWTIKIKGNLSVLLANQEKKSFVFDNSFSLQIPTKNFENQFPLEDGPSNGLGYYDALDKDWDKSSAYIQIKTKGYINKNVLTTLYDEAIERLKSFCGLTIALNALRPTNHYKPYPLGSQKFYVHKRIDDSWKPEATFDLDLLISETFGDLVVNDLGGSLKTDEDKLKFVLNRFELISNVFSQRERKRPAKILLACQWLFDSYCGKNDLLAFVQTVVAIEIILGDKSVSNLMGLGELLRNRCAYLIGSSQKERDEILEDFNKIYSVRCSIVHNGKNKLSLNEKILFSKIQWILSRVIHKEIKLLVEDVKDERTKVIKALEKD